MCLKTTAYILSTFYVEYNHDNGTTEINFVVLAHSYTNFLCSILAKVSEVSPTKNSRSPVSSTSDSEHNPNIRIPTFDSNLLFHATDSHLQMYRT